MIPKIKIINPNCKVFYRSHIQLDACKINQVGTAQHSTWEYLYSNFIHYADKIICHPIPDSIPQGVPLEKIVWMPASTDPLDGLNKDLTEEQAKYWQTVVNRLCLDQGQPLIRWDGQYVAQIARFDPSKGTFWGGGQ